jgi:hypothetical protein
MIYFVFDIYQILRFRKTVWPYSSCWHHNLAAGLFSGYLPGHFLLFNWMKCGRGHHEPVNCGDIMGDVKA